MYIVNLVGLKSERELQHAQNLICLPFWGYVVGTAAYVCAPFTHVRHCVINKNMQNMCRSVSMWGRCEREKRIWWNIFNKMLHYQHTRVNMYVCGCDVDGAWCGFHIRAELFSLLFLAGRYYIKIKQFSVQCTHNVIYEYLYIKTAIIYALLNNYAVQLIIYHIYGRNIYNTHMRWSGHWMCAVDLHKAGETYSIGVFSIFFCFSFNNISSRSANWSTSIL